MTPGSTNLLKVQLPAIGLVLGVLFSAFVAVLFQLNIGLSLLFGVLLGAMAGYSVSLIARIKAKPQPALTSDVNRVVS